MKKLTIILTVILITNYSFSQSVEIKDGDPSPNTLLQINDEGSTGSISIPSGSAPGDPAGKLYNDGGTLKWSGTTLATGSSLWTLSGGDVYRSSGNVGIGISTPSSRLSVNGVGNPSSAIHGESTGEFGTGVRGLGSSSDVSNNFGGYFEANGQTGTGVFGHAKNTGDYIPDSNISLIKPFNLFDVFPIGLMLLFGGIIYLLLMTKLFAKEIKTQGFASGTTKEYFKKTYGKGGDIFELKIMPNSPLLNCSLRELEVALPNSLSVIAIVQGNEQHFPPLRRIVLKPKAII